jgi:integrase
MSREQWFQVLRKQVKHSCGNGWGIAERNGKCQVTRRLNEGRQHENPRQAVMLDLEWTASNSAAISEAVCSIKELVDSRHCSLAEAKRLWTARQAAPARASTKTIEERGWKLVLGQFVASRASRRGTTLKALNCHMRRMLETLERKPYPRDGAQLMQAYAAQHFGRCRSGNSGRVTQLNNVAAALKYAVKEFGYEQYWLPLDTDDRRELIGDPETNRDEALTPPVMPNDLANLLDQMRADDKVSLMLATALVGLYGLRPAELGAMVIENGDLKIRSSVKRNSRTMHQKLKLRLVIPLDIPGREGEGQRMLALWSTGMVQLPQAIQRRINEVDEKGWKPIGDEFRQQLERYKPWQSLVARNPGLTPYSLRHGYAWRAVKSYERPMAIRDVAALMGHTPLTHQNYYGRWTDEAGLKDAVARLSTAANPVDSQGGTLGSLDILQKSH